MLENHLAMIPPERPWLMDFDEWKQEHPLESFDTDENERAYIRKHNEFVYVCEHATGISSAYMDRERMNGLFEEMCECGSEIMDEWIRAYLNAPVNRWMYNDWLETEVMVAAYAAERRLHAAV